MAACERCWSSASMASDPSAEYQRLIKERRCTPQEMAGPDATMCKKCKTASVHQHAKVCMTCGERDEEQ